MSEELLEKIDEIRARFDVTYEEASEVLTRADEDLVQALILLEQSRAEQEEGGELLGRVRYLWEQGNKTKLRVSKDKEVLLEIPATIGVIGAVLSPGLTFLWTVAALAGKCQIQVNSEQEEKTTVGAN